ncbi:MAG: hypothetical protein A3F12_02885 [Gammaproteobacteria bacterium RIFCSPHIGHO2_12_FULL_38_14]|nr:MAG: hypothetical protein A3F12_02885 [Gammaproteobacteria bacterium RIFCSPHIGHO2_12_FULL_38_14]
MFNVINSLKTWLGLDFYTSEIDHFLTNFDQKHSKLSESQILEINKYTRIYQLRDHTTQKEQTQSFWDKF